MSSEVPSATVQVLLNPYSYDYKLQLVGYLHLPASYT